MGLVGLVLVVGIGGATGAPTQSTAGKALNPDLAKRLVESARGSVSISTNEGTNRAGFVRVGLNGDLRPGDTSNSPDAKALGFLREYGSLLGADTAQTELVRVSSSEDAQGDTHITYGQVYKGVPVFGGTVKAHLDGDNNLTAVNGVAVPEIDVDTTPRLSADQAAARAIAAVVNDPPANEATGVPLRLSPSDLRAASTTLYVYRLGLIRGVEGRSQLVYRVEVTNGANVDDVVFVHAHAGKLVNRYSKVHNAKFRRVFEEEFAPANQVWQEGDPFPGSLNIDQQNIVNFSGDAYNFFFNSFGRDSYDGAGAEMQTVNNDPRIACPNANWNGITTNYCNDVTGDDTVAHEWGHAYTEYTHNLIYQWQPGALNESYSDIWGEVVDDLNGPNLPDTVRTVGGCSTHTTPIPELVINSPTPGLCAAGAASFGPVLSSTGVTGDLVLVNDGVDNGPGLGDTTANGCEAPFVNAAAVAGKIALVDRGVCGFTVKVKNAQDAGAIAVVVADHSPGSASGMGGADPTITISSLRITLEHGNLLKGYLAAGGANVTLRSKGGAPEDSFRWLSGEDDPAFGGAIRDMWNPNCLSDPGKVSDAEYFCGTGDGGGVHTNSGVPNHGFALLVDGGTFNGQTVTGLGLTKAAHIYWRAQSVYQTETTDFNDHADALEASCADLLGATLKNLSTGESDPGDYAGTISGADCAEVTDMIAAVELRTDPTSQCNFVPLLDQNPPPVCANEANPSVIFKETFERGALAGGWRLTNAGVFSGWPGTNWVKDTSLPGGRSGSAAYAQDLDGQCDGGAGDVSGSMSLESRPIFLAAWFNSRANSPRLTFEHYVATETAYDGGNVKIRINRGPWMIIPSSAYIFNAYNMALATADEGNTNPLEGQEAFSGSDGGQVTGSWGQSQIDLTRVGARMGDLIQLRFDFGNDGCGAIDGWYVDDIKITACTAKKGQHNVTDALPVTAWKQ